MMTDLGNILSLVLVGLAVIFTGVVMLFLASHGRVWLRALSSGLHVPILEMMRMRLRRIPPDLITEAYISLNKKDIPISLGDLQALYLEHPDRIRSSSELIELVTKDLRPMTRDA